MGRVHGKVALLSGGATGLGAAAARLLAQEGARVVVADRDASSGKALCEEIGAAARFVAHDALSETDWTALVASLREIEGRLDVLVNCVGGVLVDPIDVAAYADWKRAIALNLDTVYLGCHHAIPLMREGGGGSIVNFASTMGRRARGESVAYSAAKAGVAMMTRSIAIRCGEAGFGIRCNCISPGTVMTAMTEATLTGLVAAGTAANRDDAIAMITALRPLRRVGEPHEVANAVLFLASDEASYVTGIDLAVDGGYSAA